MALEDVPGDWRRKAISSSRAPSDAERQVLAARNEALDTILESADPAYVRRSISALKAGGFPVTSASADTAKMTIRLYEEALKDVPEWAIAEACRRVVNGTAGVNPSFFPTAPEMAMICRRLVAPWFEEKSRIRTILEAEVYREPSAEERARVLERFAETLKSLMVPKPETLGAEDLRDTPSP